MRLIITALALVISSSAFAQPCGHLSQFAHARACMKQFAEARVPQGSNGDHLVYVTASEKSFEAIQQLVTDYTGRDLSVARKERLLEKVSHSEWAALVIQMDDEPIVHYFLLESGEEPVKVLRFNPVDAGDIFFPNLFGKSGPFTLYIKNLENWIYEMFERG